MYYNNLNKWIVNDASSTDEARSIAEELSLTVPTAGLLVNRGCLTADDARKFIGKEEEHLYDPMLMRDMEKAASRICDAIATGEKIVIYGDYDVDGVTSVASLYLFLKEYGADVSYHIPCRMTEGYGMSSSVIDELKKSGTSLVITVDTGITAIGEIAHANELGIDVVVTDHHECYDELPLAVAIVNPRRPDCTYPFKDLAGVGVVFKVMCAVESMLNPDVSLGKCVRRISREYCDLVALGTIADVMPVKEENRLIVSYGLSLIESGSRDSITELINASSSESKYNTKKKITAAFVGFTLAPRINAAGRIKNASTAVELLLSNDPESAAKYAKELCSINKQRQNEENKITEEAYAKIADEHDFEKDKVIVLTDEKWHHGIIGIVASRITEKYGLPSILISYDGNGCGDMASGDIGKGSGRSVKGINLVEALSSCSDILEKYGGHELAAGLSVKRENIAEFKRRINEFVRTNNDADSGGSVIEAEAVLSPDDLTMRLASELYYLEPFGVSNPVPIFKIDRMYVSDAVPVGGGKHMKFILRRENTVVTAMCFRRSMAELDLYPGDVVDVLFNLDINDYQGVKTLQMIVKDIRLSDRERNIEVREHKAFDSLYYTDREHIDLTNEEKAAILPKREDFVAVYNTLKKELRVEHEVFSLRALAHLLKSQGHIIPQPKLKMIIMIFREMNLIGVEEIDSEMEIYSFKYVFVGNKINLEKSGLLRHIKSELGTE